MNSLFAVLGFVLIALVIALLPAKPVGGYESITKETPLDERSPKQLQGDCPKGKKVLGAGWSFLDSNDRVLQGAMSYFDSTADGASWVGQGEIRHAPSPVWKLRLRLMCAKV